MKALSERQHDVLAFIHESFLKRGYPPTYRELDARFAFNGGNSTNANRSIHECLQALQKKGMIDRSTTEGARAITITDEGFRELEQPTLGEMQAAVRESLGLRNLLVRAWAVLTRAGVEVPLLIEIRDTLGGFEAMSRAVPEAFAVAVVTAAEIPPPPLLPALVVSASETEITPETLPERSASTLNGGEPQQVFFAEVVP